MFAKAFRVRAMVFLAAATATFFLISIASAFPVLQRSHASHDLPGCALMSHSTEGHMAGESSNTACPMNLVAHFVKLGALFTITLSVVGGVALLLVLAFFAARASALLIALLIGPPRVHSFVFASSHTLPKNRRLQEAFSQGILHSKAY
jgi:hypothetical protein